MRRAFQRRFGVGVSEYVSVFGAANPDQECKQCQTSKFDA
jgi:hypothetical protein